DAPEGATLPHPDISSHLRHALLLDENDTNQQLLHRQLEAVGIKVTACSDPSQVLDHMDDTVDLLVLAPTRDEAAALEIAQQVHEKTRQPDTILLVQNQSHAQNHTVRDAVRVLSHRRFTRHDLFGWLSAAVPPGRSSQSSEPEENGTSSGIPVFSHLSRNTQPPSTETEETPPRKMRVLAAEDNKTNRLVLGKMLKSLDIDLKFACDGLEAVEAYQEFAPDLIFMDISMPRMDGKQATAEIRKLEAQNGQRVSIVALTAHAMSGDDEEILKAGLDKYLTKPLRKQEIVGQIIASCPETAVPPLSEAPDQAAAG
ncbi:MAG: response regulator, partial [Pseudomonadota bacterium]